jgi:hypothetical protein
MSLTVTALNPFPSAADGATADAAVAAIGATPDLHHGAASRETAHAPALVDPSMASSFRRKQR